MDYSSYTRPRVYRPTRLYQSSSGENESDDETQLIHFINKALLLHKGPIHKFKIRVSFMETCDYFDQWLIFLSRNGIRMLILDVHHHLIWFCLHSSLYSCQSLTHLELSLCHLPPPPPTFKGFMKLKCLILHFVELPSSTIESLVSHSPLLQELTLDNCADSDLRICAPNLKHFYLEGFHQELSLYIPLLAKMSLVLCFDGLADPLQQKSLISNYTNFFDGITKLEELEGDLSFIKFLSIGMESIHNSLVFHELRVIKLSYVDFHDVKGTSVVVRLITDAPNLRMLKISSLFNLQRTSKGFTASFWDSESAPNFTFERLKVIEMEFLRGLLDEMKLIKFLLASAPVLEKIICKPNPCLTDKELLNLTAELLTYHRASTNAEILISKS